MSLKKEQSLIGKVISTKMDKTVNVEVTRVIPHPVYKKRIKKHKKVFISCFQGSS